MFNILAITKLGEGLKSVSLNWIGKLIRTIIEKPGYNVGIGIILFTIILKLITLPFDIISRVSTKKNSIKMEKMRPELERLQKQYAKNKQLYQQKVMALQKKAGYSPLASCLPSIISIIIFMVVIGAFNTYSKYATNSLIGKMNTAYNASIEKSVNDGWLLPLKEGETTYEINTEKSEYDIEFKESKIGKIAFYNNEGEVWVLYGEYSFDDLYKLASDKDKKRFKVDADTEKAVAIDLSKLKISTVIDNLDKQESELYKLKKDSDGKYLYKDLFKNYKDLDVLKNEYKDYFTVKEDIKGEVEEVEIDLAKLQGKSEEEFQGELLDKLIKELESQELNEIILDLVNDFNESFGQEHILYEARMEAKKTFNKEKNSFLWIKNIWEPDTSYKHPLSGYSNIKDSIKGTFTKDEYNELTAQMSKEKNQANGYYILIVLSIGVMVLSQIIAGKDQKTQVDLGSVEGKDGTMGQTQKMMKFIMPVMFGIFAFIYTSAFSIYMIISSLFSTLSTLLISLIVSKIFEKKEKEEKKDKRLGIKK